MTSREWTLLVWALLGGVVVAWFLVTMLSRGRFPTLGAIVGRLIDNRVGRVLLTLGWMWLGWHAFAR
jgi:hypothetical protein